MVLFVLLLSGCGATSTVIQAYQPENDYKINYSVSMAPQVEAPEELLVSMQSQLHNRLSEKNLLPTDGDIKIHKADILITHYRMRSDAVRFLVGIMAGCDKITSKVTIVDLNTKNTVGQAEIESNECAALVGAPQVISAHMEKISYYLSGK